MKRKDAVTYLWIVVIPLLLIASGYPTIAMPGQIVSGHAGIEGSCNLCHQRWHGTQPRFCLDCHEEIEPAGHGRECGTCHPEHRGRNASATRFDHELTGYILSPAHLELACRECHPAGYVNASPGSCISCHAKVEIKGFNSSGHFDLFTSGCIACHLGSEPDPSRYNHELTGYALPRKFEGLACRDCHPAGFRSFNHTARGYEMGEAHQNLTCRACHDPGYPAFSTQKCVNCHEKAEVAGNFSMAGHVDVFTDQCLGCHGKGEFDASGFDHSQTRYRIDKHHFDLSCRDCHPEGFTLEPTCNPEGCHRPSKLKDEHLEHGITDYLERECIECHISKAKLKEFKKEKGRDDD